MADRLQFRRFAGCPIGPLHLHAFAQRIKPGNRGFPFAAQGDAGVAALPFALIVDRAKTLYQAGV
jgi:hypothetical protein